MPARRQSPATSQPWPLTELLRLYAVNAAAMVALMAAWWAASGTVRNGSQVLAIAVGVTAVVVSGSGNAVWLMVGRRNVGARRAALRSRLEQLTAALAESAPAESAQPVTRTWSLVTLASGTRYHIDGCELVKGKPTVPWKPDGPGVGRLPCGVCRP